MTWAQQDPQSLVNSNLVPMGKGVFGLKPEAIHDAFYVQCSQEDEEFARSHLVLQAAEPFGVPMATTAQRWGSIPRFYIECLRDRALTLGTQRAMQQQSPCRETFAIDTDQMCIRDSPGLAHRVCQRNALLVNAAGHAVDVGLVVVGVEHLELVSGITRAGRGCLLYTSRCV